MKKLILIVMCTVAALLTRGQEQQRYTLPEAVITPPELMIRSDGHKSTYLNDYLKANIRCPESAVQWDDEGVEIVRFAISPAGQVENIEIVSSVSSEIDDEITRVLVSTSGMWRASLDNGKPVASEKEVAIVFVADATDHADRFLRMAKKEFATANKKFLKKQNSKDALYNYDRALCYMPHDKCILTTRGMCKYQLGDKEGACRDWNRVRSLGGLEVDSFLNNFCEMDGFDKMIGMVRAD